MKAAVTLWLACVVMTVLVPTPGHAARGYQERKREIEARRREFARAWSRQTNIRARQRLLRRARAYLSLSIPRLARAWIGTSWSFSGTSQRPRHGAIACGYFVSTVLRDAGFRLSRVSLAQQPASHIIRTFVKDRRRITTYSRWSSIRFAAAVGRMSPGIYIVGLDRHVGLIFRFTTGASFVHSNYYPPKRVAEQSLLARSPLTDSAFRMLGELLTREALQGWIRGRTFATLRYKPRR